MERAVVLLHRHPELLKQCCDLVNSEWKRSDTARMRSLQSSSDTLPTCLILIQGGNQLRVIGHCKLSAVPTDRHVCFVESVVIDKALRGHGHGSYLMRRTEEYCRTALGLRRLYLSTIDQEQFYAKLGYRQCGPISIYGTSIITKTGVRWKQSDSNGTVENGLNSVPKPPTMPLITCNNNVVRKTYMYKDLVE